MSRENVEVVRALQPSEADLVELFAEGNEDEYFPPEDVDPFAEDFHVEFVSATPGVGRLQYSGVEGFVEGWRDWLEPWASYHIVAEDFIDAGEHVVALVRVQAKTARDGVVVEHEPAAVWTVRGGKVTGVRMYLNRADAFNEIA